MISLNIEDLKPGMILAQPVRNHQGVLLLEAGAKITKKNIRIFKSWGVSEIVIKGDPGKSENTRKEGASWISREKVRTALSSCPVWL